MDGLALLLALVIAISCASLSLSIAKSKGLPEKGWMLAGLLLGPLGVLGAAGMADRRLQELISRRFNQDD